MLPLPRETVQAAIIDLNRAGVFVCDRDYRIGEVDAAFLEMEGLTRAQVIGKHVADILGDRVFALRKPVLDAAFEGRPARLHAAGARDRTRGKTLEVLLQPVHDATGAVACVISSVRDVTPFQKMRERLSMHEEIVRQTTDRISVVGTDFRYKMTNAANAAFYGMEPEDFPGLHVRDLIGAERFDSRARRQFEICFAGTSVEYEHELRLTDTEARHIRVRMDPYRDDRGRVTGAIIVLRDITEAAHLSAKLRRQAREDALTGLCNRHALKEALEDVLARAAESGESAALVTIDLDEFKIVNDLCGHSGGDALLRQIADMLRSLAGEGVHCARLGGDEFALVCRNTSRAAAVDLGERVIANLATMRFTWDGRSHAVSASVGIAPIERAAEDGPPLTVHQLLSRADRACLYAKELGGARPVVYRPDAREMVAHRTDIGNFEIMTAALADGRFQLHTMPIRSVRDREPAHAEVLLRFVDEAGRVLAPATLIASAERHGVMPRIDRWVVATVLAHLDEVDPATVLTINLSGLSIGDPEFRTFLLDALDARPGAADRLAFEITETAAVRSMATAQGLIDDLRARGSAIILDDFGSGLSSFAYLRQFRIDCLKIDGALIGEVASDPVQETIVAGIVAVARKLGIDVIAEYVEDACTLETLADLGVTMAQGYYIGRPQPWVGYGLAPGRPGGAAAPADQSGR